MLRRLALRDFVIVTTLEVDLGGGFSVLTGETGAGKSILVDALQLALGSRGDVGVVREGAARADISAEFDVPASLRPWLEEAGFAPDPPDQDRLLLRRTIDAQGKSRAWVNGSSATLGQLREAADHLVDIHGQHAWQSLTRAAAVRDLLDRFAGLDSTRLSAAYTQFKAAGEALASAQGRQADHQREHERLSWQIAELDKLAPAVDEWDSLNAEHRKLSNAQGLIDAARAALEAVSEADPAADQLTQRALDALGDAAELDQTLASVVDALRGAQTQLRDAAHSLASYLNHTEPEPDRLQVLDDRLSAWMSLARRYRRPPAELPALLAGWKGDLLALDAAGDMAHLQQSLKQANDAFDAEARLAAKARQRAAPRLSAAITHAMQQLGMAGGRFEVALVAQSSPQSFGSESAEFLVAGHEGSTPRPMARVASGGELSRIALAVAVTTSECRPGQVEQAAGTLIFDEIDAGVGGAVAETVGRLMKRLGRDRQVLAVTHLPQVAACADSHFLVSKQTRAGHAQSEVHAVVGEARVAEIARMLGGERLSSTSLAHAQEMLSLGADEGDAPANGSSNTGVRGKAMNDSEETLRQVVVVTGISGSGKSVALHALEDAGFFCVDNLPPELLPQFMALEQARSQQRLAVAVDVRAVGSLPALLPLMERLRLEGVLVRPIFLDASTDALVRRFSETRRPHPLSKGASLGRQVGDGHRALIDAIELERELLADLREVSTVLDTSQLRPAQLRLWLRELVQAQGHRLTLVFESFAFKHGVPLDADLVFDVRVLPNPYYEADLRALNGRDAPVVAFLQTHSEVAEMLGQIEAFVGRWLPNFEADHRSYLTVAIGCTGGQHRSVYMAETLAHNFAARAASLVRHRELDER